jgi:hypothetical protein
MATLPMKLELNGILPFCHNNSIPKKKKKKLLLKLHLTPFRAFSAIVASLAISKVQLTSLATSFFTTHSSRTSILTISFN